MNTDFKKLKVSEVIESKMERMEDNKNENTSEVKEEKIEEDSEQTDSNRPILDEVSGKILVKEEPGKESMEEEVVEQNDEKPELKKIEEASVKLEGKGSEDCNGEKLDSTAASQVNSFGESGKAFSDEFQQFAANKMSETIPSKFISN